MAYEMIANEMPERIWATRVPKFQTARDQGVTVTATSECLIVAPTGKDTEYVSATTHQRTLEALREALEEARERVEHWADVASRADRTRYDTSDDLAKIDAALARIKEATP